MVLQYLLFIYGGFLFPFGSRAFPLTFGALLKQLLKVFVRKISRTMSSQHWSSWDFPGSSYAKYPGYFEYYVMGLWLFLKFYVIKKKKSKKQVLDKASSDRCSVDCGFSVRFSKALSGSSDLFCVPSTGQSGTWAIASQFSSQSSFYTV